jgi:predicted signal transduction protein with EAL and GGDEF domain
VDGDLEVCVARHGGDEFTVLIHNMQTPLESHTLAGAIIATLSEPFQLRVHEVSIGVSIGIAFCNQTVSHPLDLISQADTAMYCAKTSGRGRYRIYDPEMQVVAAARLALENDIRAALKSDQFHVVYQPIISLKTGRIESFEALSRWQHPHEVSIGPEVFVPILESLGLVDQLGEHVLKIAGHQIELWNEDRDPRHPLSITLNCSTLEFNQPNFSRDLLKRITQAGVNPRTLRLEVTESALMETPESARKIIEELREFGIKVGLDDFGTGYSSLAYLHRLPLDLLKIDKSFVHAMRHGNEGYEIVRTIISLAQGLNLDVVAEGVETLEQHNLLTELGCTHAQGFLYSRPLIANAMSQVLATDQLLIPMQPQTTTGPHSHRSSQDIDALLDSLSELTSTQSEYSASML